MTENELTDQDQREDSIPRGNGALIGRFLAVGLFVALGTFAVIQSLSGNQDPLADNAELGGEETPVAIVSSGENPIEETPVVEKSESTFGGSVANTKPTMPATPIVNKSGTFATTLKPATTPVVVSPRQTTGTFGSPGSSSLSPSKSPPSDRIALLDNGSARSSFGIGGPAIPPASTRPQAIDGTVDGLKQKVDNATSNVSSRFSQFGSDLGKKANDATGRVQSALGGSPTGSESSTFDSTDKLPSRPIAKASPFTQNSNPIKPVEANPSLESLNQRPFESDLAKTGGFQSRPLNPIANTSTQQPRTPFSTAPSPRPNTRFPAKTVTPSGLPRDPFTRSSTAGTSLKNNNPIPPASNNLTAAPPRASTVTQMPSANSRVPAMQASRVSPTPGDRQYEGVQAPSMIIQKSSPKEIQVNQTADFEIKIRNVGRVAVDDVLVVDRVPTGAEFIDANPKPSSQSRGGEIQWQLGTMKPGEERTILLQVKPTEPGEIGSVAQFYFGGRASNRTKVTQPKLKISHTTDPKILIGNNVVFDVIVENTGNGPAKDVVIQEEVPELLEYQDGSRELEFEVGTLLPGQSRRIQLGLRAARVGRFRNVMFASAKGGLQAKHETDIEIIAPKLETSSDGPTLRFIQRQVTHTFTVANKGTADATNLQLVARLPSGLRYVNANNRGRYDRNSHTVVWQMRDLAAGGSGDVEVTSTPIEAGEQNIKFEAAADLNQKSETVQKLNVEHLIDVFFDIDDVVDPIEIGAATRYRIKLVNQGTQAASNIILQVDFPAGLEPTAVDGDLRNEIRGQQILFEAITSLRSGEELNVIVQAKGRTAGDHRVVVKMKADGRDAPVSKEETTRVYSDR